MRSLKFLLWVLLFQSTTILAQNDIDHLWTLEKCIDYSLQHNLTIKKSTLDLQNAQINYSQSKREYFPTINSGASQNVSNGSIIDPITGDFVSKQVFSSSLDLNGNMVLFNGFKTQNQVKQNKLITQQSEFNLELTKDNITLAVLEAYIQVMYAMEGVKIAEQNLESYETQLKRSKELLQSKSITLKDFAEVQSQVATAQYELINAQKNGAMQLLVLKQLMELPSDTEFYIEIDQDTYSFDPLNIPDKRVVFQLALQHLPEIKTGDLTIKISELKIKTTKSNYYPTLSLTGSLGTGYTNSQNLIFRDQITGNFNQRVGLSLSIPIYDKGNTKSNLLKSKNEFSLAKIERETIEKEVYKKVENAWLNAISSYQQTEAALASLAASKEVLLVADANYQSGNLSATDFIIAQTNYNNAEMRFFQAKYMTILYMQLLNFYQGKTIKL